MIRGRLCLENNRANPPLLTKFHSQRCRIYVVRFNDNPRLRFRIIAYAFTLSRHNLFYPGGYSGFQVTGMIEGFLVVLNSWFRDLFGEENLASIFFFFFFLGGGGVLFYVGTFFAYSKKSDVTLHNVIEKQKMFLGVSSLENSAWDIFFLGRGGYFLVQGFFRFC